MHSIFLSRQKRAYFFNKKSNILYHTVLDDSWNVEESLVPKIVVTTTHICVFVVEQRW